ncbi:ABC-2 transporter permease [Caproicibacter fermentans]|uniref:ABC-2 transporter permease n=1 Tax=Caproicibacter fermentans TaxID=2576756 RepID=A0A7G8T6T0_9FIRM|nr:ABC-2 transporter permease [Caproicibacter fermentans]QNK39321.1 ABC-2 transporter permease [Caproicibacter fermentans]
MGNAGRRALSRQAGAVAGLFFRELKLLCNRCLFLLLLLSVFSVFYAVAGLREGLEGLTLWTVVILPLFLLMSSFEADQKSRWDSYLFSLPVSRLSLILPKFLLGLLGSAAGAASALLAVRIRFGEVEPGLLRSVAASFEAAVILCCVLILVESLFDFTQAKILFIVLSFFAYFFAAQLNNAETWNDVGTVLWFHIPAPAFLLAVAGILFLSVRAVSRREVVV